ncbi:DUF1361 domain-containing protein [Pseudanabaena sp. FACHB-2040]|uniref:DUF1361 domain-containing protein n=1 Tax=Pseudanabaena sp. FACHB-2040 TaxID=2692859 RepID=UPI001685AE6A|nr:DUF1361 domain-containing protein [Pseudanabaena sp. FACHB-2040]MBD2260701.1 DUF1361 domain-containing protein [Pseudanabaena sp. FACHB-2040]
MREHFIQIASVFSNRYSGWILWNLFLAFIPLALSFWLFRQRRPVPRNALWWLALIVYVAFLPNAPYVLTDIIHFIRATRDGLSIIALTVAYIPLHVLSILAGFEAYVVSLLNQGQYLRNQGAKRYVLWAELMTHALAAVGVFIGRFRRFNSWDIISDPDEVLLQTLDDLTSRRPLAVILAMFLIIAGLYWLFKQITLGLVLRMRYARLGKEIEL